MKIERNYIIVANNSAQKRLDIYDSTASYSENERPTMESEGKGLTGNADSGKMMLDKREITGVLENIPKLLTQARLVPNFTQGKADGFRVVSITPDSFYAKIGIKNGDVLQRINGMELREPDSFFKVFQQLKDESSITLDLIRNNKKETLDYEIQ
ncbi:MAG: PDZ domain-containing protein [Nitrospirota bacterium]